MPQATIAGFLISAGVTVGTAFAVAAFVQTILINLALGAIARALARKPRAYVPPINVSIRNPVENRRICLGTVRAGGCFAFVHTSGENNKFLWYIVVFAGHQCSKIGDVILDTSVIANANINGGAAEGGAVTSGVFANVLSIYKLLGTSTQTVNPELNAAIPSLWTANHRLKGCTYVAVKMERDDEVFLQGAPQHVNAIVDGALLYDPRRDSTNGGSGAHRRENPSTWEFDTIGRNPALQWRWIVSGGSVHNDTTTRLIKYGLRESDSRIPDDYVAAAANVCDEVLSGANAPPSGSQVRYRCDLEVSTGEPRRDILEDILATMAGTHVYVHGKHRLYAGAYDAPTHTFTERDLYGALEIEDTVDHSKRHNAVAGVFRDATQLYVEQTTPFRTDAGYEAQDGGKRIPIEIDLRGVTNPYQAQRLCEIKLRQSRMMRSVKLLGALNLLKVTQHETLTLSHARYSWSGRIFRCIERQFDFDQEAGRVALTCTREDAAVYTDLLTADYVTGTSTTDEFVNEVPDAPTNPRTTGLANAILLQCDRPATMFAGTQIEWRESTASSMTSPTTVYLGADLQFTIGKTSTANYYYQVRTTRNGQSSAWVPATNGVLGKASSASTALAASVSPGTASSSSGATSQTTNSVTVTASGGSTPYTYAWTWASGGSGITITSASAASTTFSATGLGEGVTRSGVARCTVTDNVSATYTIDVDVEITRPAPTITIPDVTLTVVRFSPADASGVFKLDNDGKWYSGVTTGSPTTDRGFWCNPPEYAADFEVIVTRTAGTETVFTSGPALATAHSLGTDREWRLTESTNGAASKDITFTIQIRRIAGSVVMGTRTGNYMSSTVEAG